MSSRNFKQDIDNRLASLTLTPALQQRIRAQAAAQPQVSAAPPARKRTARRVRRSLLTVAAACLALVFGLAAAASAFPAFDIFIQNMGEDLRQLLQPIAEETIHDGIRMQVVAAVNDEDTAVIYLTLQDLEGNRIDETTELHESNLDDSVLGFGQMVHFDKQTRTATYRLESKGENFTAGKKITVNIKSLLSGGQEHEKIATGLTLANIMALNANPTTTPQPIQTIGISYGDNPEANTFLEDFMEEGTFAALEPASQPITLPGTTLFTVSNAGLVNGFLHIQQNPTGMEKYNLYSPFLIYPGQQTSPQLASANMGFGDAEEKGNFLYFAYTEHILELPENCPPEEVELGLWAYTYQHYIEGNWKVTFMLDETPPTHSAEVNMQLNTWMLDTVTVSNIAITGYGHGEINEHSDYLDITIVMQDGSTVDYIGSTSAYSFDGSITDQYSFTRPIDPAQIKSVHINGQQITFNTLPSTA